MLSAILGKVIIRTAMRGLDIELPDGIPDWLVDILF